MSETGPKIKVVTAEDEVKLRQKRYQRVLDMMVKKCEALDGVMPTWKQLKHDYKVERKLNPYEAMDMLGGEWDRMVEVVKEEYLKQTGKTLLTYAEVHSEEIRQKQIQRSVMRAVREMFNEEVRKAEEVVSGQGGGNMDANKRQEILDRVLEITWEKGGTMSWLSERTIRRDPILVYREVQREFGSVDNLRKEAQEELSRRKQEKLASRGEQKVVRVKPVAVTPKKQEVLETPEVSEAQEAPEVQEVLEVREVQPAPEVVVEPEPELEPKSEPEKPRWRRKNAVDLEDARADMLAAFRRLGRMPSQAEIVGRKVGTKYSYRVYMNALGPKDGWCEVLGVQETALKEVTEAAPEVETESEVAPAVVETAEEPVERPEELEMHEIVYPIRVIVPKGIKATVTVSFQVE